ncbi:MAG: hypothetical protein PHQ33_05540 [Bacteroidales bacterium]|nr:hypothetical protein [Bacteroidales bacterium]
MRNLNIKLDLIDFTTIRDYIREYAKYIKVTETVAASYQWETLYGLWIRMSKKSTLNTKKISLTINIPEAVLLFNLATRVGSMCPLETAVLRSLAEQIESKGSRYVAEVAEYKKMMI